MPVLRCRFTACEYASENAKPTGKEYADDVLEPERCGGVNGLEDQHDLNHQDIM